MVMSLCSRLIGSMLKLRGSALSSHSALGAGAAFVARRYSTKRKLVNQPPGVYTGKVYQMFYPYPDTMEIYAKKAIEDYNNNNNNNNKLEFVDIVDGVVKVMAGYKYYLTLKVKDEQGNHKLYLAQVFEKAGFLDRPGSCISFKPFPEHDDGMFNKDFEYPPEPILVPPLPRERVDYGTANDYERPPTVVIHYDLRKRNSE